MADRVVCLYHASCSDGLAAAWAVTQRFSRAECIPVSYGTPPPNGLEDCTVLIVDFSYPLEILKHLAQICRSVTVFDHHTSACEPLHAFQQWSGTVEARLLGKIRVVYDTTRSGAKITWEELLGDQYATPKIIEHISDRDLWLFKLADTKAVCAGLSLYPMTLESWTKVFDWYNYNAGHEVNPPDHLQAVKHLAEEGRVVLQKNARDLEFLLPLVTRTIELGGYTVPLANLPLTLMSEGLHILSENQPFAVGYYDTAVERVYYLRSHPDQLNVAEIAKQLGGGGRPHASGFKVSRNHPLGQK